MSKDQVIRERAYAIWESEGRPDGMDEDHWKRAELLVEEQSVTGKATATSAVSKSRIAGEDPELIVGGD